jgi:transposase
MQRNSEALNGLVVGHKRDGRCRYDPQVKQELIRQCMLPGVSVARMAMQHGVNANLLRTWITKAQISNAPAVQRAVVARAAQDVQAFVPVQVQAAAAMEPLAKACSAESIASATALRIQAQLPNGISVDLGQARIDELSGLMQMLSGLPCSR